MREWINPSGEGVGADETNIGATNEPQKMLAWINSIEAALREVFENSAEKIPKKCKRFLISINHYKDELYKAIQLKATDEPEFLKNLIAIRERANSLTSSAREEAPGTDFLTDVLTLVKVIRGKDGPQYGVGKSHREGEITANQMDAQKLAAALDMLKVQLADHQQENNRFRKQVLESKNKAEHLDAQISTYETRLNDTIKASSEKADLVLGELLEKQKEVNELVGMISGETMAASYAKSAESERKLADAMRYGCVILMLTIVSIIGYSLLDTANPDFEWKTSLLRLVFSLTLSVPAAYFARESAKHRTQQYSYLRVSLDLQAITPYLASLPDEQQHRLKEEIANRIFGGKDLPANPNESYPLNMQELFMALLAKIEVPKSSSKSNE